MALIMMFGVLVPLSQPVEVQAIIPATAMRDFNANLDRVLVPGGNDSYAPRQAVNYGDSSSLLYWPVRGVDIDDKFVLTWYPDDDIKAEMTFRKMSDFFIADFNMYRWVDAVDNYVRYSAPGGWAHNPPTRRLDYSVYDRRGTARSIVNLMNDINFAPTDNFRVNGTITGADGLHIYDFFPYNDASDPSRLTYDPTSPFYDRIYDSSDPDYANWRNPTHADFIPNLRDIQPNRYYEDFWRYVKDFTGSTPTTGPAIDNYFKNISPSFYFPHNGGFSFEYYGSTISFLWGEYNDGMGWREECLMVSVDGLTPGNIYDFTLEYAAANRSGNLNDPYDPAMIYIFPGIELNSFAAIPFSVDQGNKPNTPLSVWNRELEREPDFFVAANGTPDPYHPDNTFDTSILNITPDPNNPNIIYPAKKENGLSVRFNLPKSFNRETRKFETVGQHTRADGTLIGSGTYVGTNISPFSEAINITFDFSGPQPIGGSANVGVLMTVRDIVGHAAPPSLEVLPAGSYRPWHPNRPQAVDRLRDISDPAKPLTNRMEFSVIGFPAQTYINNASMSFSASGAVKFPGSRQIFNSGNVSSYRPIFTFMDMEIQQMGDRYYLGVTQFALDWPVQYQIRQIRPPEIDKPSHPPQWDPNLQTFIIRPASFNRNDPVLLFPLNINPRDPIGNYYQILFMEGTDPGGDWNVFSQIILYNPQAPEADLSETMNFRVMKGVDHSHLVNNEPVDKNIKLYLTETDPRGDTAHLEFWTQWDVIKYDDLIILTDRAQEAFQNGTKDDNIVRATYRLEKVLSPIDDPNNRPEHFADVLIEMRRIPTSSPAAFEVRYSVPGSVPEVLNEPKGGWHPFRGRRDRVGNAEIFTFTADVHFKTDAARVTNPLPPGYMFYYPNIYFMNVRPTHLSYVNNAGNPSLITASRYDSMTLSDLTHTIPPPPQQLRAVPMTIADTRTASDIFSTPVTEDRPDIYVQYRTPLNGVRQYLNTMTKPDFPEVSVNLYIGINEDVIKQHFYPNPPYNQTITGRPLPPLWDFDEPDLPFIPGRKTLADQIIPFVIPTTTPGALGLEIDMTSALNTLRYPVKTGVVCIENIPLFDASGNAVNPNDYNRVWEIIQSSTTPLTRLMLTNLDINQKYYIFADLVVTQWDNANHGYKRENIKKAGIPPNIVELQDISPFAGLIAVTTAGEIQHPDPGEVDPIAPRLRVRPPVGQTAATIEWDKINPDDDNVRIEYEIIRLDGWEMSEVNPNDFGSKEVDFINFFNNLSGSAGRAKTGWRTEAGDLYIINNNSLGLIGGRERYDYYPEHPVGNIITLEDKTLSPNHLYFYYARTLRYVLVENDPQLGTYEKRLVSSWSRVTVTTTPVQPPRNLRVERERTDYNRMSEVIVSWDSDFLDMGKYGTDFIFQYQLKENENDWTGPHNMPIGNFLLQDGKTFSEKSDGSMHFVYKLTGLKTNSTYQMRVCLFDIGMNDRSLYTNTITFITGFDQDEYDRDKEVDEWVEYIRKKLNELLGGPYWVTLETPDVLSVVVRPGNNFNALLLGSPTAAMSLYGNDADSVTYYIPASVLVRANAAEKGFLLPYEDLDILTAPRMINETVNDTIINMSRFVKDKDISDYFIRLTVQRTAAAGAIEGHPPLTKETSVRIDAVGTVPAVKDIAAWDQGMFDRAVKLVEDRSKDPALRQAIRQRVDRAVNTEEMMRYLDGLVLTVRNELMRSIHNELRVGNGTNGIFSARHQEAFGQYDAAMFLVAKGLPEYTVVNGYSHVNGGWVNLPVTDHHNGKAITVRAPGRFVFSGREVNIPGIENVPKGGNISAFTAKYGLEDYLGYDGVDLNQNATRYMVAGCVARMAGAPKDADPIAWVNANLNVTLSSRNANSNVQVQEAAAMVMALYEKRTNTSISKMTIRNFQATARMTGLDDRYRQAVRAGFETTVLTDTNMRPADAITIRVLLDMLAALDAKVKL
jgi:hypothetical protein